jgi:hypothetical protein
MARRRTTHRSSAGNKLYAVRDAEGQFEDIQSYQRAHGQDLARDSAEELATAPTSARAARGRTRTKPKAAPKTKVRKKKAKAKAKTASSKKRVKKAARKA